MVDARKAPNSGPEYDEVLHEVIDRVAAACSVGKMDIGALLFWKRLRADTRWVAGLMQMPDRAVRVVTETTVGIARDRGLPVPEAATKARASLSSLPGFARGDALASAVLLASAPDRMAVYDRRAHRAVRALLGVELGNKPGRYGRYMSQVVRLMDAVNCSSACETWTARDVDLALYTMGVRAG